VVLYGKRRGEDIYMSDSLDQMDYDEEGWNEDIGYKNPYILMVLGVLLKYSDENNPMKSYMQIAQLIETEYGVGLYERNKDGEITGARSEIRKSLITISNFLDTADFGYTLEYKSDRTRMRKGKKEVLRYNWYIARDITEATTAPLIDFLMFSKYMPSGMCMKITKDLERMSGASAGESRKIPVSKTKNSEFFLNIEMLNEAKAKDKKVVFKLKVPGTDTDGKMHVVLNEVDGSERIYDVSPIDIVMQNGKHYLLAIFDTTQKIYTFRVDFIFDVRIMKHNESGGDVDKNYVKRRSIKELEDYKGGWDLSKYMREHIFMYDGDSVDAVLLADKVANPSVVTHIRDWFGTGNHVKFINNKTESVEVHVRVNEKAMLYWALQFGTSVTVLKPESLRKNVAKAVRGMYDRYCTES